MYSQFDTIYSLFKNNITLYDDDVKFFIEMACNKIPYFRPLSMLTKQELIFSMERETFEAGHFICKKDDVADRMYLIQEGVVEITSEYSRNPNSQFVIERLGRGAIINHRSFMLKDDADTDFRCKTTVSAFILTYEKMKAVKNRRQDLKDARRLVKEEVFKPLYPLALDYIFHNNNVAHYDDQIRQNELTVKIKNAIMQSWSEVKKKNKPPSLNEMIEDLLKKKREGKKKDVNYEVEEKQKEILRQKLLRKRERIAQEADRKEQESKDSYLKIEQFDFIYERVNSVKRRLKGQQDVIDMMEKKMLTTIKRRHEKEANERP